MFLKDSVLCDAHHCPQAGSFRGEKSLDDTRPGRVTRCKNSPHSRWDYWDSPLWPEADDSLDGVEACYEVGSKLYAPFGTLAIFERIKSRARDFDKDALSRKATHP